MKKSTKKWIALGSILILVAGIIFAVSKFKPQTQVGSKEIQIIIEDRSVEPINTLLDQTYHTDCEFLGGLLDEHADEFELNLSTADPTWGRSINGMMGLEIEGWNTGPWWMYTVNDGYADAIDMCAINNGDIITFYYSSTY